jgi:2-keto-4-pentenoate hydratase/2-oxohepta-3-ene-1,7-dioic acid hydratase in catechol pathway
MASVPSGIAEALMRRVGFSLFVGVLAFAGGQALEAQESKGPAPFRLGTFEKQGRSFVGLVKADGAVVDVASANSFLEAAEPGWPKVKPPADMKELIARYESGGLRERLAALARDSRAAQAPHALALTALKVQAPIRYPTTLLNAAVNYSEHDLEMRPRDPAPPPAAVNPPRSARGIWERRPDDTRQNPYLFIKAPTAVIADGEAIQIPPGRDQVDWECEMGVVIGRGGSHIPLASAADHIFGYTLEHDVSDRGGRGDSRHGSDWLIGKSHDTFAPLGPFIVPREFVKDPQNLPIKFSLSGTLMQDSTTARMIHSVYELVHYASNILTLRPGDVIATGSPAGVGSARNPPIFMKPGDVAVCTIEGIGTLTNPVAASPADR